MKRILATVLLFSAFCIQTAAAQDFPNGLASEGIDPKKDSLAILRVRNMLDSIRTNENRPTVALVLSGGGVRGSAYVGLLKYMEEAGIPIDFVCGTSMGGIVAGLIAMGYDSNEMNEIFNSVDWSYMLGNKLETKYLPIRTKAYKSKYILSLPFHYNDAVASRRALIHEENPEQHNESQKKLLATLPTGYVNGFNIDNMLASLTVGYHDINRFSDLPIPYFCVSSDLVTCKANYASEGDLRKSIRASMAIPGVFAPVRTDGMILVDGGSRNNFPVDIAKAVGADIIIGAEMGDRDTEYSKVNSIGDILTRLIAMLGDDARAAAVSKPDLYIKPDSAGYGMLSFSKEAIRKLIESGYEAAKADSAGFVAIKAQLPADLKVPQRKKAVNINKTKVRVSDIRLRGVSLAEGDIVREILNLTPGTDMSAPEIEDALCRLQATGSFENVSYSLAENMPGEYSLTIECLPGQLHNFGFGLRFDTEEYLSAVLNLGLFAHKLCGSSVDFTLKVGNSQQFDVLYTYRYPKFPSFNIEASVYNRKGDIITENREESINVRYVGHREQVYISTSYSTFYNVKVGLRNQYDFVRPEWYRVSITEGSRQVLPRTDYLKGDHLSAFASGEIDTYDTHVFPAKGISAKLWLQYDFLRFGDKGYEPAPIVALDFTPVIPVARWFSIIPDIHMRSYFAGDLMLGAEYPMSLRNYVGGNVGGRHIDQQIRFIGVNDVVPAGNHVGVANLDLRFNPAKNLFVSLLGGYVRGADYIDEFFSKFAPSYWAAGAEVGYRTIVGPIKFQLHWSNLAHRLEGYFSLGFDF